MATKKKKAEVKVVEASKETKKLTCDDKKCHVHGNIRLHGRVFEGIVTSDKMQGTVSVTWGRQIKVAKYDRFMKRKSKVKAHNPICIRARVGDKVRIAECRPISKTVNFVVIEVLK